MSPEQFPPTQPAQDHHKPVAYDQYGRPLYAHPPNTQPAQQLETPSEQTSDENPAHPQVVYMTRAVDPHQQQISAEVKAKHEDSIRRYRALNLSEGEFVISAVQRHPIGLISIWAVVALAMLIILIGFPMLINSTALIGGRTASPGLVASGGIVLLLTAVLFMLDGIIATVVYQANRFYLTNESVIQHIQTSLFSKKDQTISLANIEDASYRQRGIIQTLLNYGSIRLSTEGDETTYRFNFVANPKKQVDLLNNAVEAFKNFRPVGEDD